MAFLNLKWLKKNPVVIVSLTALALLLGYIVTMLVVEQKRPTKCSCPYAASQKQKK